MAFETEGTSLIEEETPKANEPSQTPFPEPDPIGSPAWVANQVMPAIVGQESGGNPNAVSSAGARGAAQVTPYMWSKYGKGDPFNAADSVAAGARIFSDEYARFSGNLDLSLAAYNAGSPAVIRAMEQAGYGLKQASNVSFDEISSFLPKETQDYVPKVKSRMSQKKSLAAADFEDAPAGTAEDLKNALSPLIDSPKFDQISTPEAISKVKEVWESKPYWTSEAKELMKNVSTAIWEGAQPNESIPLSELIGPAPKLEDADSKPDEYFTKWKGLVTDELKTRGIDPILLGKNFDDYISASADIEKQAFAYRNRSTAGKALSWIAGATRTAARGATGGLGYLVATPAELMGAPETAKAIEEKATNIVGPPSIEFDQKVNAEGYPVADAYGKPITKMQASTFSMLGNFLGLFGIGKIAQTAGAGTRALASIMGGTNAMFTAHSAYDDAVAYGGSREQALHAAAFALPSAALTSWGDLKVLAGGKAWVSGLSGYNKARLLAVEAGIKGSQAALAMGGQRYLQDIGTSAAIDKDITSPERVLEAAAGGAMGGAIGGAIAQRQINKAIPKLEATKQIQSALVDSSIVENLEKFQRDNSKNSFTMQLANEAKIDPALLEMFQVTADRVEPGKVTFTRVSSHTPVEVAGAAEEMIEGRVKVLAKNLTDTPEATLEDIQKVNEELTATRKEQRTLGEGAKQAYPEYEKLIETRDNLKRAINVLEGEPEVSREAISLRAKEMSALKTKLREINETLGLDENATRYAELENKARKLSAASTEAMTDSKYANNRVAKEQELKAAMTVRLAKSKEEALKPKETAEGKPKTTEKPPYRGVKVEGTDKTVTLYNGKYFVLDNEGKPVSDGFIRYKDAAFEALSPSAVDEEISAKLKPIGEIFTGTVPNIPYSSNFTPKETIPQTSKTPTNPRDVTKAVTKLIKSLTEYSGKPEAYSLHEGGRPSTARKNLLGYAAPSQRYVWLGKTNDLPTLLHEAKHVIQNELYPDFIGMPPEVMTALKEQAVTTYPAPKELTKTKQTPYKEGMAMFMEHYMTGQPVQKTVLDWYNTKFKAEYPEVHKALEDIKPLMKNYIAMDPLTRAKVFMGAKAPTKAKYTTKDFIDNWINQYRVLEDIDKVTGGNLGDVAEAFKGSAREKLNQIMNVQFSDFDGNLKDNSKSFKEAIAPAKGRLDELSAYQLAKYTLGRALGEKGTGFPTEAANEIIKIIENESDVTVEGLTPQDRAGIRTAARQVWEWNENLLDIVADRTTAGAAIVDAIRNDNIARTETVHGYYIPTQREFENIVEASVGRTPTGQVSPFKHYVGSTRRMVNPLVAWENHAYALLASSEKGYLREQLFALAKNKSSPVGNYIRRIPKQSIPKLKATVEEAFKGIIKASKLGIVEEAPLNTALDNLPQEAKDALVTFFRPELTPPSPSDGYVTIMNRLPNGKTEFFEVHPRILKALDTSMPDIVKHPLWHWLVSFPNITLKMGATTFRMAYQLRNLAFRDFATAYRRTNGVLPIQLAREVMSALNAEFWTSATGGKYRSPWVALSQRLGAQASVLAHAGRDIEAEIYQRTGHKPIKLLNSSFNYVEDLLSVGERATRLAVMRMKAKELGITDPTKPLTTQQAIELTLAYKRSTTNFGVQGKTARWANTGIPFFTARIAELSQLEKDWTKHRGKSISFALGFLGLGIYQAFENKDETYWQNMEPEQKATNFITRIGDKVVMIPLESLAGVFNGFGHIIGESIYRQDLLKPDTKELVLGLLKNYMPISSIGDPLGVLLKEALQQAMNKDFYTKRQIIPRGLEDAPTTSQYTSATTELSKELGDILGIAPARIDHAIRGVFPAGLDMLKQTEVNLGIKPVSEQQRGLTGILTAAVTRYGFAEGVQDRSLTKFYKALADANSRKDIETPEEGIERKKLNKIREQLSAINVVLSMEPDNELRKELYLKKGQFLKDGIAIAGGEELPVMPLAEAGRAKQIKKERQLERAEKQRKKELEMSY